MAERKRRGLGRGLGALINSDAQEAEASGAAAHAVSGEEDATTSETTPERPIDVFFSAKSHLATQRVSRETGVGPATPAPRTRTASRRTNGTKRAEMPDVLGARKASSSADVSRETSTPASVPAEPPVHAGPGDFATSVPVEGAEFREIPVDRIQPNPRQPRQVFDEDDMAELVHSVGEIGVLQPIVVRPLGGEQYELIMGERRWRASKTAGRETIPAVIRMTSDEDLLRDALLENIHRSQLNPLEEAAAYQQLLEDFDISQEELSRRIGRSRPQISNTLRLMKLPPAVQRRVAAGVLSSGHARALLSLESGEQMEELAQRIVAEGLSVRAAEEEASVAKKEKKRAVSRETDRLPSTTRYEQLDEYAEALTDRLDTQVKITLGSKRGRIAIDFASLEDLDRILEQMGMHVPR
ncbi:ParB/RepB/Spo0J family partition protein [Nesterenkonia flava]|uniref:ParB/RepB/Spo0J family partition protein n=1 Tax=Nesterenkonia flava TaxID=469799 RepID=A0ABU1FSZ0_9MICC|nr:ParB/RepB/Spo0J family partition protein [Nesterenkonia flava]MDR5711790.1 ParB/RepB/Spo0J family partition protein [Nesterenkonia flava]